MVENLGKSIGNGQSTKLWKDSWISTEENLKPIGPIRQEALDLTLADILTSDLKWNKRRIEELLPEFVPQILSIQPSTKGGDDSFIWRATSSGLYTTKSGYFAASVPTQNLALVPQEEFSWIKDVWASKSSPKLQTFLWSILQNALPLGANLLQRGEISAGNCIRCQEKETATHCFFTCPFASQVWSSVPLRQEIHVAVDTPLKEIMVSFRQATCLPPTGITQDVLPWVLWSIWTARNKLIFEGRAFLQQKLQQEDCN